MAWGNITSLGDNFDVTLEWSLVNCWHVHCMSEVAFNGGVIHMCAEVKYTMKTIFTFVVIVNCAVFL